MDNEKPKFSLSNDHYPLLLDKKNSYSKIFVSPTENQQNV